MGARFSHATLTGAVLESNQHDHTTGWPHGFEAPPSCTVDQEPMGDIDLATYLAVRAKARSQG